MIQKLPCYRSPQVENQQSPNKNKKKRNKNKKGKTEDKKNKQIGPVNPDKRNKDNKQQTKPGQGIGKKFKKKK